MNVKIEEPVRAEAYVLTGALAMITARVPVWNVEEEPITVSVYNSIIDPDGQVVTTTETLYGLNHGEHAEILDELLRVRDPKNSLQGYQLHVTVACCGTVLDTKAVPVAVVS